VDLRTSCNVCNFVLRHVIYIWTLFDAFHICIFNAILFMPKCYLWMLWIQFECCLVNMLCLEKPEGPVFQTGWSGFPGKTGCSGLPNRSVRFWQTQHMILFNYLLWISCHVHHLLLVHTHFCCTPRMHMNRGSSLGFSWKMRKMALLAKIEFHSICTYLGGANSICMDPNCLLNIICKL
jgi:hypothetical protein